MTEYSPGLEGVVAAQTAISEVDGANGRLIYRGGYLIEDLAPAVSFEETAYLLWNGELPNKSQLDALRQEMAAARKLKDSTRSVITSLEYDTDPMDVLRTAVSAQGAAKALQKPTVVEAISLTAVVPSRFALPASCANADPNSKPLPTMTADTPTIQQAIRMRRLTFMSRSFRRVDRPRGGGRPVGR